MSEYDFLQAGNLSWNDNDNESMQQNSEWFYSTVYIYIYNIPCFQIHILAVSKCILYTWIANTILPTLIPILHTVIPILHTVIPGRVLWALLYVSTLLRTLGNPPQVLGIHTHTCTYIVCQQKYTCTMRRSGLEEFSLQEFP